MEKVIIRNKVDYDIKSSEGKWLRSLTTKDPHTRLKYYTTITLSGERWWSVCRRVSNAQNRPTYFGVQNGFSDFQEFVEWSRGEIGYDLKEESGRVWAIDKDIILHNSKIYSADTCIFVPQRVNNFLTLRNNCRGEFPIGVSYKEVGDKFYYCSYVNIGEGGKTRISKVFYDKMEAHRFWQENKIIYGRSLAKEFQGWHNKLSNGLSRIVDKIEDDYVNYRETIF